MASDTEQSAKLVAGERTIDEPSTPPNNDALLSSSSQVTMPSTEGPPSPMDPASSFKTELNDDRGPPESVIPSSLTPPHSSQEPTNGAGAAVHQLAYIGSQHSGIFSPPASGLKSIRRDGVVSTEFTPPTPQQVVEASPEELRGFVHAYATEHVRLKMEAAHHKLQYNLLSLQADEDAKRAAVEHEMTRREVEALRVAESSRQARRELNNASESAQAKYLQVKAWYEQAVEEIESLNKRLKLAKKVIQQKEDEILSLADERDMLLNRIRENREHFHALCSPGGIFHPALTPKTQIVSTPVQYKATPRQTPKSAHREPRLYRDHGQEPFDVLLKAATQENNSAPSTPLTGYRPAPRFSSKHTRNVQSMSSLPTTPTGRPRSDQSVLLPSVDLVPQSEPPFRHNRFPPQTPTSARHRQHVHQDYHHHERRKSRESTISAEDNDSSHHNRENLTRQHNEELARQALSSFVSRGSITSSAQRRADDEREVYESQASQAASEMLRRDPRESFEITNSVGGSRGTTPPSQAHAQPATAAEKSAKLQAKLFAGLNKTGGGASMEKRKFSGGASADATERSVMKEILASPTKKLRVLGGLRDPGRVGLGIQYGRDV